jgi:MFS superfamily sulfate permease-like transporter
LYLWRKILVFDEGSKQKRNIVSIFEQLRYIQKHMASTNHSWRCPDFIFPQNLTVTCFSLSLVLGFKWGCALGVLVSALPNGLFDSGSKELKGLVAEDGLFGSFVSFLKSEVPQATGAVNVTGFIYGLTHPQQWAIVPTIIFVIGTWFVMNGKKMLPKALPPGSEVILATALATLYSMNFDYSGGIVGEIPVMDADAGIAIPGTSFKLPIELLDYSKVLDAPVAERMGGWPALVITSLLFAGVNFLSIMGIASGFETENGIPWSAPRELIAQGVSCGVASMVGSAPVSGSMSRSLVSRMTGTTSQLACILTAMIWIVAMPYMSIMSPTPKAALSSVIVSAVLKSVVLPTSLMELKGIDFVVGWGTAVLTASTSPTLGFGGGCVLYLVTIPLQSEKKSKKD